MIKLLQHSVYELFYNATAINTFLFLPKLVEKYYFVFFSHIPRHACLIRVHKLMPSSHCYDQIIVNFLLQKQGPVVMRFISFYKFLELPHPRLKRKQKRQLLQKDLNSNSSLSK